MRSQARTWLGLGLGLGLESGVGLGSQPGAHRLRAAPHTAPVRTERRVRALRRGLTRAHLDRFHLARLSRVRRKRVSSRPAWRLPV
eukprot:scaffold33136_cov54-Phaeocystis_antarctica.AAC.3